jgi:hypothetical protein
MCTYTNNNFCWFTKSITKPKHGFGTHWFKEWIWHINRLKQLHCIDWRFSNQSVSIPHLELVEVQATPIVVQQKTTYQLVMWPNRIILGLGERSQGSTLVSNETKVLWLQLVLIINKWDISLIVAPLLMIS